MHFHIYLAEANIQISWHIYIIDETGIIYHPHSWVGGQFARHSYYRILACKLFNLIALTKKYKWGEVQWHSPLYYAYIYFWCCRNMHQQCDRLGLPSGWIRKRWGLQLGDHEGVHDCFCEHNWCRHWWNTCGTCCFSQQRLFGIWSCPVSMFHVQSYCDYVSVSNLNKRRSHSLTSQPLERVSISKLVVPWM